MKRALTQLARCQAGSDVWHFRSDCSQWPDTVYAAEPVIPAAGIPCSECFERDAAQAA
jgi:hypothetical protein